MLEIAGVRASHPCIIVPGELLDHDLLLGADFLTAHGITLKLGTGEIESGFGRVKCLEAPKTLDQRTKVRMAESAIIPPCTVMFVKARLADNISGTRTGLVEPYTNLLMNSGLLVSSCITNSSNRAVSIRVMNISAEPVILHKQKLLGFMDPVDVVEDNRHLNGLSVQRIAETEQITAEESIQNSVSEATANSRPEWSKEWLFKELKLDDIVMTPEEQARLKEIVWDFRDCFSRGDWDLGDCSSFQATIQLKQGATPVWTPSRPVAYKHRGEMNKHLNNLLEARVIERCPDSRWNNCVFLVPKPNKPGSWRFVADLRGLNSVTAPDKYELPNINHVVDKIGLCKHFSVFDMSQSFHQVRYEHQSRPYTAFTVENKRYWFLRMVMGHRNSSAQFSRLMDRLLSTVPIRELIYFLDDILLASADVASHLDKLKLVLQKFKDANLKLTPGKTELLKHEVKFVGLTISADGMKINEDRVKAILELKPPSNAKQLQSVLGFFGYNRAFIKNYAAIAKPLYALLNKHSKFVWGPKCQESFELLKRSIADDVILTIPDLDDPLSSFQVTLDASKDGFGATLSQIRNGKRKICAYYSKSVPKHKRIWSATKLEFMCMYHALQYWRIYLAGTTFVVRTDCASLLHRDKIWSTSDTSLIRKFHKLDQLDFSIEHLSGSQNHVSDFLSRYSHKIQTRHTSTQTDCPNPALSENVDMTEESHRPGEDGLVSCVEATTTDNTDKDLQQHDTQQNGILNPGSQLEQSGSTNSENRTDIPPAAINNVSLQLALDTETIRRHQREDIIVSKVYEWLRNGERPKSIQAIRAPPDLVKYWRMFDQLTLNHDIVYKKWITCSKNEHGELKSECTKQLIIIPDALREQVMNNTHGTLANLHPGVEESVRRCQMHYYWPKMREDFSLFVAACTTCGTSKQPVKYLRAPLKHIVVSDFNMCLVLDHIVPERDIATPRKMRYILSMTDMFSGYVIAKPTKTQDATESYRIIMREWVLRYGFPQEIIFDNAPGFKSQFFQAAFKSFGCKMTPGLAYSCASTSKAERSNKRINTALRVTLSEEQVRDWDLYLDYVTYGLNSIKSRHTGVSANMIVFGREIRTPLSLVVENETPELGTLKNKSPAELAKLKHQLIKTILGKATQHAQRDFMYADNTYNRNINGPFFETGDYCYLLVESPKHKFSKRWKGPYRITKAVNQHLYLVRLETGDKMCSITKMKKYTPNIFSPMSKEGEVKQNASGSGHSADLALAAPTTDEDQNSRPKRNSKPPERFIPG